MKTTLVYLLLLNFSPALTRHLLPDQVLYSEEDVSVVRIPDSDVERWSEHVHRELGGCGGFLDVTRLIEKGKQPEFIVWEELLRRQSPPPSHSFAVKGSDEVASLVGTANGDKLWAFLGELSNFPDRSATSDEGGRAARFLKDRAQALGTELKGFHTWSVDTGTSTYKKQPSIIATLAGVDPTLPGVVIGGHMDTYTTQKPGADDDGSGSSVVMEALRAIATSHARFKRTIHFAWYAAEERGLVGSSYVVDHFSRNGMKVHAAIQFDMVGYKSPNDSRDLFLINDYTDPGLNQTVRELIATYLPHLTIGETRCGYACSDHVNWNRAAIPVSFPFETSFANMNAHLHTGDDKIAILDKEHSLEFARLALAFLGELAELTGF